MKMKSKKALTVWLAAALAALTGCEPNGSGKSSREMRVVTFNILFSGDSIGTSKGWEHRKGDLMALLRRLNPDIAGFQEVCPDQQEWMKEQMPDYKVYWLTAARSAWTKDAPPITVEYVLEGLRETGADGVDCQFAPEIVTADFIRRVRDAGYEFHVWTIDQLALTLQAFANGAQTVTTNCAKRQLDEYRSRQD